MSGVLRLAEATPAVAGALRVRSAAHWPGMDDGTPPALPALPAFVLSAFSPLAAAVADRCLRPCYGDPASNRLERRTAVVLMSATGDTTTAHAIAEAVGANRRVPPLLFFQSVPNAVAGYVAATWGLVGPVVCASPVHDSLDEAMAIAEQLLAEDAADEALLIGVELAGATGDIDKAFAALVDDGTKGRRGDG